MVIIKIYFDLIFIKKSCSVIFLHIFLDENGSRYLTNDLKASIRSILANFDKTKKDFTLKQIVEISRQVKFTSMLLSDIAAAVERWGIALMDLVKKMDSRDLKT